ncbi:MAG: globin [Hydrogenophilales bacterium CG17_big_fil_post_rev_8_21_14_2_50_63_12]|nr:MAG: globin [Hydrogenophilales bacterium CG17_big_fil_post_rev_8_21_14_2_50_63_12]PIX96671.1 MAG: globin [Hydrogenophilales bacterium CG_4_10_14_3_um_filter_63_21]PJB03535.1 MAG: globin [Hydrogenophilales bacterium CG_4_9_14_3_um_filter_63_34]
MTHQTHYQRIGGAAKVRQLVDRFYDHMDELPEAYGIRKLHPEDLSGSRQKLLDFLTGWMGGPQGYVEKHGNPMLRRRHLPFPIADSERDQWLHCMQLALDEAVEDGKLRSELYQAFVKVAGHMRNQPPH